MSRRTCRISPYLSRAESLCLLRTLGRRLPVSKSREFPLPPWDVRRTVASVVKEKTGLSSEKEMAELKGSRRCRSAINDALSPPHSAGPTAKHCGFAVTAPMPRPARGILSNDSKAESLSPDAASGRATPIGKMGGAGPSSEADSNRYLISIGSCQPPFLSSHPPLEFGKRPFSSLITETTVGRASAGGERILHWEVFE